MAHPPYKIPLVGADGIVSNAWISWVDSLSSPQGSSPVTPTITDHASLTGRDASNSHPVGAITGLNTALASLSATDSALASLVDSLRVNDGKVGLNSSDMQPDYLASKIAAGNNVTLSISGGKIVVNAIVPPIPDLSIIEHQYTHNQSSASTVWNVVHNLGYNPSVTVQLSNGTMVFAQTNYIDVNNLTLTFSYSTSGFAYCT